MTSTTIPTTFSITVLEAEKGQTVFDFENFRAPFRRKPGPLGISGIFRISAGMILKFEFLLASLVLFVKP